MWVIVCVVHVTFVHIMCACVVNKSGSSRLKSEIRIVVLHQCWYCCHVTIITCTTCNIIVCPSNWLTNVCITQHTPAGVAELVILADDQLIHSLTLSLSLSHHLSPYITVLSLSMFWFSYSREICGNVYPHNKIYSIHRVIGVRITKV